MPAIGFSRPTWPAGSGSPFSDWLYHRKPASLGHEPADDLFVAAAVLAAFSSLSAMIWATMASMAPPSVTCSRPFSLTIAAASLPLANISTSTCLAILRKWCHCQADPAARPGRRRTPDTRRWPPRPCSPTPPDRPSPSWRRSWRRGPGPRPRNNPRSRFLGHQHARVVGRSSPAPPDQPLPSSRRAAPAGWRRISSTHCPASNSSGSRSGSGK